MKPWKDLSMKERGAFIRVGVKNGITSVDGIRDAYNKFACGGHKFDDGGPKLTPEEQYQEMVNAKMMSAPLLRFGDERGSWRWSRNLGAEAYMPEIEVVAENKSGKSTTKREEQPTAIKNERLTEEEKKEEEKFWTNQRDAELEMAVTRRPEGYWREQGLEAPILSTGRPADEPIDWQGTGYNHSPEYQKAMSQYRIANMTPEQRWAMTDDQMFKGEVLNAGMGIMMAPAFNPIASIGSGIMDLKYNKNKDWTNYVGDALAIGLPIAGTALNAPTYYRNVQNLYNQGRRVYDMYKYLESLPTSYTGVPQSKVAQFEAVMAGKIPRTFSVWTSDNKLLGEHGYAKKNGMTNGKLYNVRDLNRNRYILDTPRAKDYGEGVNAVSWYNLPYDVQTISNRPGLVDLPNSKIEIDYAPQNTIRERLTGKTRTYAASKHKNTTDLILYKASRIPNNQGVIFNDITDGTITSVFKLPFEKYHRVVHWDTPIINERVYNPKAQLLLTPNEPTWMSAWRYRNNQGLRNRMLMEKGYKPDKIFSPQELRKGIMNASYARGGKLFNKFQDGGTKLSNGEFNSILRRQAEVNAKYWGVSPAEAYRHMLNDPTYDYRGFYEANPDAQNNPETHWPDTYKTYSHSTFSNESKYSGRIVFPYNPTGAVGGRWEGDEYIPNDEYHRRSWEEEKARMNQKAKGGRLAHKFDGTSEPTQWMFRNKNNPNDLISEAQFEEMFGAGDERFKDYEGVRVAMPRQQVRQQQVRQQQEEDHLYKDGRLDEITVRPDIAYNSDVRNIPALETTEEPISDEWRKRFANSVGQQRRQAQMTPAEQWANYYTNLANLSYEDRVALANDRKFKRFIGGVAGGLITAPVTIPAIAGSIAYAPEAYSWLMQKGLPAATEFMSTKLNPGWWADQATLGARQLAQKYGLSALESGLSALTGEVGLSGMAGGFSGFGSSTIPGMALNAYLGAEMGYNAVNNLINKPFSSPDRTWKDNAWDALGLTGGIATGLETGISTVPALNQLYGRTMIGADTFRDYFTGRKNIDEIVNIINREFTSANKLYDTGFLPKVTKVDKKAMSKKPVTFRKFLENLYGREKGRILYRALRKADSSKMNQLEKQYAQAIDYSITNRLRQNLHEWAMGSTDDLNIPEVMEDAGAFDMQAYQSWLNSSIGKRQVARLNRAIAKLNPNYEKVLKQQYGYVSPVSYKTALANAFNKNTRMYERFARGSKRAIASSQLKYLERLGELDRATQLQQNIMLSPKYPSHLPPPAFLLGNNYYTTVQGPKDTVINLDKAKNKDIKKFYERFLKEHNIKDVRISISPEGDVVAESNIPTNYSIVDENRLSGNMPIWDWENKEEAALLPYNITVEGANDQTVNNTIKQVLDLKKGVLTDNGESAIVEYGSLNVPTKAKRNLEKFVQGVIDLLGVPGHPEYNAQLMGSLSLFLENGLASAPGDIDLITTTTRINNCPTLRNALAGVPYDKKGYTRNLTVGMNGSSTGIAKGDHDSSSAFGKMGVLDINEIKTDADDNILTGIDPNTGRHVNELAVELYRQFFPEDFNRELQNAWLSRPKAEWFNSVNPEFPIQFTHLDPETGQIVPLKGEDLMNAYNPVTKAVIDALEIDFKSPNKEKHKNRIFQFMQWGPAEYVSRGIRAFAQSRLGSHYNPPINLAEAGLFNNAMANKQMLSAMGYHFGTPLDPQRMQNAFELWYLDATLKYRGISPQRFKKPGALDNPENFMANLLSSVNEWFYGQPTGTYEGNGYSNGVGLNSASSQTQYGDIGMFVQLPVNFNGVTSPSDAVTAVQRATGTNYRFTEEDLKNMPITSALIKPGNTSKQLLKSATNHFDEIRSKNGGKTLEAGKWFEEWQRELKDNGIYGLTDPIGSYTQNNAYTSLTNNVVDNNIQAALKTNVNQGLSRDLPQRNMVMAQSTSLSYMKTRAFKDTGNALLGLRDSNIDYSREWGQLALPTVRKKYGMDMVNAVKEYYNSDLYKEFGKLDGEAIVPGIRSFNQLIMEGEESTPLYDKIINEYGEDKGKKMIHLINVNELMRLIEYCQNPVNSPYITSSKITVRTLERGQGLLHSNIGDRRKFDRGMTDYDLLVDAGYSPDEIEEAVELHNEKVNNNDRIVTTTEYRGKKYRDNVNKVEDEISISKDNVRRAKELITESQKDYRGYLEKVRRTSPNQDDETAAKDIMRQHIKSRNHRIESMLTHRWDRFMGDLLDGVTNKNSYGGSLNLNDQYGIGKYINY